MKFNGIKNFVLNISWFHEAGNEMFLLLFTFLAFNKICVFPIFDRTFLCNTESDEIMTNVGVPRVDRNSNHVRLSLWYRSEKSYPTNIAVPTA